jgi:hypothetical protein
MEISIKGGANGNVTNVGNNKRIWTETVNYPSSFESSYIGNAFNINTDTITLTTANKSAVCYVKNTGDLPLVISSLFYILGASTGGSGDLRADVLRNPTAGTIVTNAVDVGILENRNFGSSNTFSGDAYKGAEGNTFTNGNIAIASILSASTRVSISVGDVILTKGSSLGIDLTPPAGNTSMDILIAVSCYYSDFSTVTT